MAFLWVSWGGCATPEDANYEFCQLKRIKFLQLSSPFFFSLCTFALPFVFLVVVLQIPLWILGACC